MDEVFLWLPRLARGKVGILLERRLVSVLNEPPDIQIDAAQFSKFTLLVAVSCLTTASPLTSVVFYVVLTLRSMRSPEHAFLGMLLSCVVTLSNPVWESGSAGTIEAVGRWLCFLPSAYHAYRAKAIYHKGLSPVYVALTLLSGTILVSSYAPSASFAKLCAFSGGLILSQGLCKASKRATLVRYCVLCIGAIVFLSVLTLPFSSVSYARNGSGFQGFLSHPQTFAVFASTSFAFLVWVQGGSRQRNVLNFSLVVLVATLFLSESRTGFFAALFSVAIGYSLDWYKSKRRISAVGAKAWVVAPLFLGVVLLAPDSLQDKGVGFFRKRSQEEQLSEALIESRSRLALKSMANFLEHPLTGIGFGLPSVQSSYFVKTRSGMSNVTTEKGVVYVAILEESGLVGGFSLCLLLWWLLVPFVRYEGRAVAIPLAFLISNLGEATLFAFGGVGFWGWLLSLSSGHTERERSSGGSRNRGGVVEMTTVPFSRGVANESSISDFWDRETEKE